jgi:hypothetical protein
MIEKDIIYDDLELHYQMRVWAHCDTNGRVVLDRGIQTKRLVKEWDEMAPAVAGGTPIKNGMIVSFSGRARELDAPGAGAGTIAGAVIGTAIEPGAGTLAGAGIGGLAGLSAEVVDVEAHWDFTWKFKLSCTCNGEGRWNIVTKSLSVKHSFDSNDWFDNERFPRYSWHSQ